MARLLYLVHRIPFPPNKGDKIRSFNILKCLAQDHDVVLGSFIDDLHDVSYQADLEQFCETAYFETVNAQTQKIKSLAGLLTRSALTITFYRSPQFQAWVDSQIAQGVDAVVLFSSAMARFIRWDDIGSIPVWMDFVDLDSDKWRQYAASKSGPEAWLYKREARSLFKFEKMVAARASKSSFVTQDEVALFKQLSGQQETVIAMANGVDLDYFTPGYQAKAPGPGMEIVFTGAMDYWANVDAVTWFADKVLPLIQNQEPTATFTIVGSKPTAKVLALQARQGVSVTGFVDDVRDYVCRAKVCVAPMRIARGVQNKVLEAMAMGKPVVATTAGFEGIDAKPGKDLLVEDEPKDFAKAVTTLLNASQTRQALGRAARQVMENKYHWAAALEPIRAFSSGLGNRKF